MIMLSIVRLKKKQMKRYVTRLYYKYGMFCSLHPMLMIFMSCSLVILCSLPLTSFPLFEKILAFLFQRITVNYTSTIHSFSQHQMSQYVDANTLAFVQQLELKVILGGDTNLTKEQLIHNAMETPPFPNLEKIMKNEEKNKEWSQSCLKVLRDSPSMNSLRKRIKFTHSTFHADLKVKKFYQIECLHLSPTMALDSATTRSEDLSQVFKELSFGQRISSEANITISFTLFMENYESWMIEKIKKEFDGRLLNDKSNQDIGNKIEYKFVNDSGPSELIPLSIAYVAVFLYLWFSIAHVDLLRTRWGLAFSAVMNFLLSFGMSIGICATFDVLPTTLNVGQIFPYVVILIGIENFWVITKTVMGTRKELDVQDRMALGLATEGWYITKNLLIELLLLFVTYSTKLPSMQEFSIFAMSCYLSDFFLQMTFFVPILAVDIRRAEVGLPFTNKSAWVYAFCLDDEKPEAAKNRIYQQRTRLSTALKISFGFARYRVLQRSIMVMIFVYLAVTVSYPYHTIVTPSHSSTNHTHQQSCVDDTNAPSWLQMCGKHWPELFNYYFVHMNDKNLIILPSLSTWITLDGRQLTHIPVTFVRTSLYERMLAYALSMPRPALVACIAITLTLIYRVVHMLQVFIKRNNKNIYSYKVTRLDVPRKDFVFKLNAMVVDETNMLVCSFNDGSLYVWDLYNATSQYQINRKTHEVRALGMNRSTSVTCMQQFDDLPQQLPLSVWSLAYKSDVLVAGCQHGLIEVYSLENRSLQCKHESENKSGIISVQIVSCLRFVVAHESGTVEFYHLKTQHLGHKRTSSLPASQCSWGLELSRSVVVSSQPITDMQLAINKLFVTATNTIVKVLRASDDGGIPMHSNLINDQEINVLSVESCPEAALVGTSTGNVYVLGGIGQTIKNLSCGVGTEVMSVCSDEEYIAVLACDGVVTVWLKEGYIKWWQVNLLTYGGAYEILSMARYTMAAVSQETVIILNVVSRNIVTCVDYDQSTATGIAIASPVVCQNKSALVVPCEGRMVHLQFPKLVDHDR